MIRAKLVDNTIYIEDGDFERAKYLPGARYLKSQRMYAMTATAGVVDRMAEMYGDSIHISDSLWEYAERCRKAEEAAHSARNNKNLPDIPITKIQPVGTWYHQRRAFWFAYPLDACMLAVTMGGGKTKIAIDLLQNWKAEKTLIISPKAGIEDAWVPQLGKYLVKPLDYAIAQCDKGNGVKNLQAAQEVVETLPYKAIVIINHESFWREPFRSWAVSQEWDLIIADEVHREKSAGSLQSNFLYQLSGHARKRLGLTGTPMPHSPLDVYGQYRFLDRGIYGTSVDRFRGEYAIMGGFENREVVDFKNLDGLKRKFFTIGIEIDDSEQGLPKYVDLEHRVTLEPKARAVYDKLDKEAVADYKNGEITAANFGVKLLRLHQIAAGFAAIREHGKIYTRKDKPTIEVISTAKLDGLREVLNDFAKDEPIVVFSRFRPEIDAAVELIRKMGRRPAELSGTADELQWWKKGKADVLVAQIQAVKEAVDLTRSSVGIFLSTGISLGDYEQCRKRLHRPPQTRMVRFIHMLVKGTKDVSTVAALRGRKKVIRSCLAVNGDGTPTSLS